MSNDSPSSTTLRIAVIGCGISGLTAAYRLSKLLPAAELELFEASDRLGGVLHTAIDGDYLLELGADSFIDKLPAAVELCHELGLSDQIIPTNQQHRRALVLHGGKLHPVPTGFVQMRPERLGPMVRTPLLSWRGKLRLLAERWVSRSARIDAADFDESVATFATRRLGKEVFERLVQPLLAGIYTADASKLSVAATMESVIEAERKHGSLVKAALVARAQNGKSSTASGARYASFVTLQGGLTQLIQTLESKLHDAKIHLGTPIDSVMPLPQHQWAVSHGEAAEASAFDGVIVALPAPRAGQLLAASQHELSNDLQTIPYASSAVVGLVYRREQIREPIDGFGIVVPAVEGRKIVAASFSSVKFPGRAPEDQVLIRVFIGGALQSELLNQTDDELMQLGHDEISEILGISGEPVRAEFVRWQEKMPQYHVGHVQLVDRIEQRVADLRGFELAGNAYRGVGIPQCVKSGDSAARRLAETLGSAVAAVDDDSAQ